MPAHNFRNAILYNANFDGEDLTGSDFTNADLGGASFRGCTLEGAVFDGADLSRVDFGLSNMANASMLSCSFADARVSQWSNKESFSTGFLHGSLSGIVPLYDIFESRYQSWQEGAKSEAVRLAKIQSIMDVI